MRIKFFLLTILIVSLLTSCEMISNAYKYKDTTKEFVETLLKEDYNKAIDYMAMEHEMAKNANVDSIKAGLKIFRNSIVKEFGTELDYSLMKSEKKFSTIKEDNTPPNTTVVLIEFSNKKEFSVFKVLFDDKSQKILNINTFDRIEPIPSMTVFWLFGLLAICVPVFNIYVIRQIKRSDLKKKWLKYIAVFCLNVPAITYAAVGGLSFNPLNFQFLLGISFNYMGHLYSAWTIGFPLGGLYWFWKLKQKPKLTNEIKPETDVEIETLNEEVQVKIE